MRWCDTQYSLLLLFMQQLFPLPLPCRPLPYPFSAQAHSLTHSLANMQFLEQIDMGRDSSWSPLFLAYSITIERIGSFQWVKLVKNTPEAIEHFLWLGKPFAKAFLFFVSTLRLLPFLADATVLLLLKLTTKLMILMSSGGPLKTQLS